MSKTNLHIVAEFVMKIDEQVLQGEIDPYAVPKSMGIFKTITSPKSITSVSVATRIVDNHEAYKVRYVTGSKIVNLFDPFVPVLNSVSGAFINRKGT
jgi:ethanolamine-phosphate cytidylyltransferase